MGHSGMAMAGHPATGHEHTEVPIAAMVRDHRNRFVVAAIFSVPVLLWSPIGRQVLHFTLPAPFGVRDDWFQLVLSLPVIFYSCRVFFDGAVSALRARNLDMNVLVSIAVASGWV